MRVKWKCHYCRKEHFHPSSEKRADEQRPIRSAERLFCTEVCVGKWEQIGNRRAS